MNTVLKTKNKTFRWLKFRKAVWLACIWLLGFGFVAKAADIKNDDISFTDNRISGYITVKIPIYDDDMTDEYLQGDNGKSYLSIAVDGSSTYTKVMDFWITRIQSEGTWYWYMSRLLYGHCAQGNQTHDNGGWKNIGTNHDGQTINVEKINNTKAIAEIRYYLPSEWLGKQLDIKVQLDIYYAGGGSDYTVSNSASMNATPDNYSTPSLSVALSQSNPGYYTVSGSIASTTGSAARYYGSGASASNSFTGSIFSYEVPIQDANRTETASVKYVVSNNAATCGEQSTTKSGNCNVPGYPVPSNLTLSKNSGKVILNWTMATTGNQNGTFVIQRSPNADFTGATTVASDVLLSSRTYEEDISDLNLDGTYYYRIHRSSDPAGWEWKKGVSKSIAITSTHRTIISAKATQRDNKYADITWTYDGELWSTGSKIIISRINISTGGSKETVAELDYMPAGRYTDELLVFCNAFKYEIYIKPGRTVYPTQTAITASGQIIPVSIGDVDPGSLTASKGYFSDRVELGWRTDGGDLTEFTIQRREYGAQDSEYMYLDKVSASEASTYYNYTDLRAVPGVIYEYKIEGACSCAGKTLSSDNAPVSTGFRTPTGDFYGRVTFESGQAEAGVEINVTTEEETDSHSLLIAAEQIATVNNTALLQNATAAATLQAWVSPAAANGHIIAKSGEYVLGIKDDKYFFTAGDKTVTIDVDTLKASKLKAKSAWAHLTGVYSGSSLTIYINGDSIASVAGPATVTGNASAVTFGGGNFAGNIDEVRIWNKALTSAEIKRDYNRYLVGDEAGLIAYYTFNYATAVEFYDISYHGTIYSANHGKLNTTTLSVLAPSSEHLGYRGITGDDGSYSVRSVPYKGNGTVYNLVPRLGIHRFESQKEVRLINANAQSHTVNFIDKSSFRVQGYVTYENSIIPVQGVNFSIDGKLALKSNGTPEATGANGEFVIFVPVGVHEVKATMTNHTFVGDGRITNPNGTDRNYQDAVSGLELKDSTTIKFIGRVAGGNIQEAYPLGHSLSKNNLADGTTVTLTHTKTETLTFGAKTVTETHFKPSNAAKAHVNTVEYKDNKVTIHVNDTTGEFVAYLIPEQFTIAVNAPGHPDVAGSGESIDLSRMYYTWQNTTCQQPADSVEEKSGWRYINYPTDTVKYQFNKKFIKRYTPEIRLSQQNLSDNTYFGTDTVTITNISGKVTKAPLWNGADYTLGKPAFVQYQHYLLQMELFEKYAHKDRAGNSDGKVDEVPTQDAVFKFNNDIASGDGQKATVKADEKGTASYIFIAGDPELTGAVKRMELTATYGSQDNPTSINWTPPASFAKGEAYIIGGLQKGTDFVTAGPNKILTVLRDPPGSRSYSYLEKGVSFSESSFYTGSIHNEGSEEWTSGLKTSQAVWTGVGGGTSQVSIDIADGTTIGIVHEEEYRGQDTKSYSTTTTTRFQTSAEADYVGADADVYIGYATNITVGSTDNVSLISRQDYDAAGGAAYYANTYRQTNDWALVRNTGISLNQSFNTLFAYPQIHIEERLIPGLKELRNGQLLPAATTDVTALQAQADADSSKVFYVSYFSPDSEHFGKSNGDETIKSFRGESGHGASWVNDHTVSFDGPSYKVIHSAQKAAVDTIAYLNQAIKKWEGTISDNEERKVNASKLQQNYSFHGGSSVGYSESYANRRAHESSFHINVGAHVKTDMKALVGTLNTQFAVNETVYTSQGGSFSSEVERSHSKGFVLEEEGSDYISVDVFREPKWEEGDEKYKGYEKEDVGGASEGQVDKGSLIEKEYYPSFIFKTRGGATSCPYEGEYVTKYYGPGMHVINAATLKKEVPYIDMPNKFIENVPSGETAKFTLQMRNNSESKDDAWYNLKIVSSSNPDGARMYIDGAAIGNGLEFLVPAGETLVKTLEVGKGSVMNYDSLQITLQSQCQDNIADTVTFAVHYTPSCSPVNLKKPSNNWTYNTKLPVIIQDGIEKHYMEVQINGFNVNYDNFRSIRLQYKSASQSDDEWITLMNYYNDSIHYKAAVQNGLNAEMIKASDAGTIRYNFFMDDMVDQYYDLRAVSVCNINNEEVFNESAIHRGLKDTYLPRLFGNPQPADGILDVEDDIRLNFNEPIADGLLTRHNFQVRGIRNGTVSDHSTSVRFDGINDYMDTGFAKKLTGKDITVEMWIQPDRLQNATLFSHGNSNTSLELSITADNKLALKTGTTTATSPILDYSPANPNYADGSWAHVALVYNAADHVVSAYYNYNEVISRVIVQESYDGISNIVIGKSIANGGGNYAGKMHNVRVWEKAINSRNLQLNSLLQLAGIEEGLMAYYPMTEGRGALCEDKARGASLTMHGTEWSLPDGYAAGLNGTAYLKLDASTAAFTKEMDYTVEFWFKAEPGQANATIIGAGSGERGSAKPDYSFAIGFDGDGKLSFTGNEAKTVVDGEYRDNNWHHFAISVDRTKGRAQIYIDGNLSKYIDASTVGGIASDYIYVGARGWYAPNDALTLKIDNHFRGAVDDIRFWELYRSESLTRENNNVKLSGTELGLVHYYPFDTYIEFQGQKFVDFTNQDKRISQTVNPETDEFTVVGGTSSDVASKDIAPLKDSGPVANLEFDFVVNNDALIINLKEQEYKIARTIVTFTVTDVRDRNGNSIASPITWSAYIDRNQLRWETDRLDIAKPAYAPYEFTVKAVNSGGAVRNYTITNVPSWLDVTPASGTLKPKSYDMITFSINEGLNVGTYNEVVYLVNEDGVPEPLALNITVQGEKPDWSVDPKKYIYTMSVFGKMRFDNIFSADKEDMLAAFNSKGECVGVTTSTYNKTLDMWYTLLTIYSNSKGDDNKGENNIIDFRMWDASTGKTYKATPSIGTINFENDAITGDMEEPVIFDGKEIFYQNISLTSGWNWVSFNLKPENNSEALIDRLKKGVWTKDDQIKILDHFFSYSEIDKTWLGTKKKEELTVDNLLMYIVHSSQEQVLPTSGFAINPKSEEAAITVKSGWNHIGYIPSVNMTVKEALAGYDAQKGDVIKSQNAFAMYSQNTWTGNLNYLEANKGYMLKRTATGQATFNYPVSSAALSNNNLRSAKAGGLSEAESYRSAFAENMVVVATTTEGLERGDRINAYINSELRGTGDYIATGDSALSFITISGNETGAAVSFELNRNGRVVGIAGNRLDYKANAIVGSIESPLALHFGMPEDNFTVYPNPFKDKFTIIVSAGKSGQALLKLSDLTGRTVFKETRTVKNGINRIEVNGASLKTGIYLLQVTVDESVFTSKVKKQ